MEYRHGNHTKYKIEFNFVWVTKYRYQVLHGDIANRVRGLVRQACEIYEIKVLQGVVRKDHLHIIVSAPPDISPSGNLLILRNAIGDVIIGQEAIFVSQREN